MRWQVGEGNHAYLARRINNLCKEVLPFVSDGLAEGVLDRGIVTIDKMAVHKLDRQ